MTSVLSIALSGLNAASTKANAAANNIVNSDTVGAIDPKDGPKAYTPVDVVDTSVTSRKGDVNGTKAEVVDRDPATVPAYDPESPYANKDGLVAAPNVDEAKEITDLKIAAITYKANAVVVNADNSLSKALFGSFDKSV